MAHVSLRSRADSISVHAMWSKGQWSEVVLFTVVVNIQGAQHGLQRVTDSALMPDFAS